MALTAAQQAGNRTQNVNAELDGLRRQLANSQQSLSDSEVGLAPVVGCWSLPSGSGLDASIGMCLTPLSNIAGYYYVDPLIYHSNHTKTASCCSKLPHCQISSLLMSGHHLLLSCYLIASKYIEKHMCCSLSLIFAVSVSTISNNTCIGLYSLGCILPGRHRMALEVLIFALV